MTGHGEIITVGEQMSADCDIMVAGRPACPGDLTLSDSKLRRTGTQGPGRSPDLPAGLQPVHERVLGPEHTLRTATNPVA